MTRFLALDGMLLSQEDIQTFSEAYCFAVGLLGKNHPNDVRLCKSERDFVITWNDGSQWMKKVNKPRPPPPPGTAS